MVQPQVLIDSIKRQLQPIQSWLDDPRVTEIMINPGGHVFVESSGVIANVGQLLDEGSIHRTIISVGKTVGKNPMPGGVNAIVYASIDDLRFSGALKGISPDGSFICIRKHQDSNKRPTMEQLIEKGMITKDQADRIEELVIKQRKNLFIVGGTGSGKTTLLNALLNKIPHHERIQTIEDSREIQIQVPNFFPLVSNPDTGVTSRDLVKLALRTRPDRLILGETRGEETYDLIRAFNSGHPGSISTLHADSAEQGLSALEMMFQMSLPANASLSESAMRQFIASSVNLVVFINRSIKVVDDVAHVVRKVEQICNVKGVKDGKYDLENIA